MADSNITKRALARALKDLMREQRFEKISVGEICEACEMNRKSFYYHFKDKYDLVEWIFNTEFIDFVKRTNVDDQWEFLGALCRYFYEERAFYVKVLAFRGQNSFRQYFREFILTAIEPILLPRAAAAIQLTGCEDFTAEEMASFYASILTDTLLLAIFRWLEGGAKMPPDRFVALLRSAADYVRLCAGNAAGGGGGAAQE